MEPRQTYDRLRAEIEDIWLGDTGVIFEYEEKAQPVLEQRLEKVLKELKDLGAIAEYRVLYKSPIIEVFFKDRGVWHLLKAELKMAIQPFEKVT